MTAPLLVNGIELPTRAESWRHDTVEAGERTRSQSGKALVSIDRRWNAFSGQAVSEDPDLLEALRGLLNGEGWGWRWYASGYADNKGTGPIEADDVSHYSSGGKYDGRMVVSEDAYLEYPLRLDSAKPWSISVWEKVSGAWHHWVETGGAWYYDGDAASAPAWFATEVVAAGIVGLKLVGSGEVREFSDLLVYPFELPLAWISIIANYGAPFPKPPLLTVSGTLMPNGIARTCRGEAVKGAARATGAATRLETLDFRLEED